MKTYKWIEVDEMILKIMSSKFWENYWHGYDALKDELWSNFNCSITEYQVRFRVKELRKMGKLQVMPTFDDVTGLLNGSGYFITPQNK